MSYHYSCVTHDVLNFNETDAVITSLNGLVLDNYFAVFHNGPEQAHIHFQLCFKHKVSFNFLKQQFQPEVHIETTRTTPKAHFQYCINGHVEFNIIQEPKFSKQFIYLEQKRETNVQEELNLALKSCATFLQFQNQFFNLFFKYSNLASKWYAAHPPEHDALSRRDLDVSWYWGPTGTGKSYQAREEAAKLCQDNNWRFYTWCLQRPGQCWFDGYTGQEVVLFEEVRGNTFQFSHLLQLLDPYDLLVEVKGSSVMFTPRTIYITSPYSPQQCFPNLAAEDKLSQLLRRIKVTHFNTPLSTDPPAPDPIDDWWMESPNASE
jgi:hypothetical protein